MSSATDKPMTVSGQADETASWALAAAGFVAWATQSRSANLDFSWRSLGEVDRLIEEIATRNPVSLRTRMGLAAYVGEVLVRQFGGQWATGERYGQVKPPESAASRAKARVEPAQPIRMVDRRLGQGDTLQHQVFEQSRAWSVENGVVARATDLDGPASMMRMAAETFVKPAVEGGATWLDFSPESVDRLDELIAESWPGVPEKGTYEPMVPALGAYVGEVLVRHTGANWIRDPEQGYGVERNGQVAFPMTEVSRRFELGPEHAIGRFYREVAGMWSHPVAQPGAKEKRGLFGRGRG
jgi:hypothetical protein